MGLVSATPVALVSAVLVVLGAALGASLGSFAALAAERAARRESIVTPPSACSACGVRLATIENVPVLAYLALRGRCRHCRAAIPLRLFLFEIAGAAFGAAAAAFFIR